MTCVSVDNKPPPLPLYNTKLKNSASSCDEGPESSQKRKTWILNHILPREEKEIYEKCRENFDN